MPKGKVTDLITDQEMAFARLILAGTMNDRDAAQAAGLNPDTAAYTKAKPCVRAYMLGHGAAVQQQLAEEEAEGQRQLNLQRERLLGRLWEIADTSAEKTRGSFTSQIKALSMIGAMEGLIPDRRAGSAASPQQASPPTPDKPQIYQAAWLRKQQEKTNDPGPSPTPAQEEDEPVLAESEPAPVAASGSAPGSAADAPAESSFVNRVNPGEMMPPAPDTRVPFFIQKNRFGRRR